MFLGAKIPNDQPLINIQYADDFMYPTITLPLNILGHYSNIICKYIILQIYKHNYIYI